MNSASNVVLTNARLVTAGRIIDQGWLCIADSQIAGIGVDNPPEGLTVDLNRSWLLPGFIDIHCHGGGGSNFSQANFESAINTAAAHQRHGTTTMLASLISQPITDLEQQISVLAQLTEDGVIAGIHLEGPFLSQAQRGAHNLSALRLPDQDAVQTLLTAGKGYVRMVTLAPELEHGISAIRQVVDAGATAAIGHSNATEEQTRQAINAGASVATHLYNGMRSFKHKDPGIVGAVLDDERISVELICDLLHVHPTALRLATQLAKNRIVLVTDAIDAAAGVDGVYDIGGLTVNVVDGISRVPDTGALAGSTLTMDRAFRNAVQVIGLSMLEAADATATLPAKLIGIGNQTGQLKAGLAADLVVMDGDLNLQRVMTKGAWVNRSWD